MHKRENRNASWLNSTGTWIIYVVIIVLARILLSTLMTASHAWTVWNASHAAITLLLFHWIKGVPFGDEGTYSGDGKYDKLTLWEQIDMGVQYTPTRKFMTLVPVVMFLLTSHFTDYDPQVFALNSVAFFVIIIAKQPFMLKKRIFGINA